jgi:putative transposase
MDERHLFAAARYVSLNPVRARLVNRPEDWRWSSAKAHIEGCDDGLVTVRPLLDRVESFAELLAHADETGFANLRTSEVTGRPLGDRMFVAALEAKLGRTIERRPGGRPPAGRKAGDTKPISPEPEAPH